MNNKLIKLITDIVFDTALNDVNNLIKIFPKSDQVKLTKEYMALITTAVTIAILSHFSKQKKDFQIMNTFYNQIATKLIENRLFDDRVKYDTFIKPRLTSYLQLQNSDYSDFLWKVSSNFCFVFNNINASDIMRISGYFDGTFVASMKTFKKFFPH